MKFAINRTIQYVNNDRVLITKQDEDYFKRGQEIEVKYLCQALIKVTEDFDMGEEFIVLTDSCSVQIRPKSLFKNNKGVFYKNNGSKYLTDSEVKEMECFVESAKIFIQKSVK